MPKRALATVATVVAVLAVPAPALLADCLDRDDRVCSGSDIVWAEDDICETSNSS